MLLLDVTPLSLGIETLGGVMHQADRAQHDDPDAQERDLLDRGRQPDARSRSTCCRASARWPRDNRTLGRFHLVGIPPAPRGVPQVEVTFDIDANGIVNVSAKDLGTGKEQKITITASSGLTEDEIEKMVKDAEAARRRGQEAAQGAIEARNQLDGLVYSTEKTLNEHQDKLQPAELRRARGGARRRPRRRSRARTRAAIEAARERSTKASHKLAEAMYQQRRPPGGAAARGGGGAPGGAGAGDDDVIDAEVVDVDKSNN